MDLCDRPLDEVSFAASHNAHSSYAYGYAVANGNQNLTITEQLELGIRGLLIDSEYAGADTVNCHGPCNLGQTDNVATLAEVAAFLQGNPAEVVLLILQDGISPQDMEADFVESGAVEFVYTHEGGSWPTLRELIDANTRLLVSAESGRPPPAWYHHVWDLAFDTPFTFETIAEMSCVANRGTPGNDLLLVNHWLSNSLGLPAPDLAGMVNDPAVLRERVQRCASELGHRVNFVAVDFADVGDVVTIVDELNDP